MFESVLRVKYVSFKNCFIYLSPTHQHLSTGMCIKVTYDGQEAYFSASLIRNTVDDDSIGINSSYAKILGIREDEFVNVLQVEQLPVVNSTTLLPFTKSDYEVLEILSQNIQSNLLDQVRVVNAGQKLIIWIGNSLHVPVRVENVKPIAPGILDFLTEVTIKPPDTYGINTSKELSAKKGEKRKYDKELLHLFKMKSADPDRLLNKFDEILNVKQTFYFRLMPLSELPKKSGIEKYLPPFTAFVSKKNAIENGQFFSMSQLENSYLQKKLYIKLCFLEDFLDISEDIFNANCADNIFVENSVLVFMQSDYGTRVVLKKVHNKPSVEEIEVHSRRSYLVNVIEKLKIYLADQCKTPIIFNANYPFEIDKQFWCSLKFLPNSNEFCIIDQDVLRNCSYSLCDDPIRPLENIVVKCEEKTFCPDLSPTKDICNKIISVLFKVNYYHKENIILIGKSGMGKTSVLNHISTRLKTYPYFVNTEVVNCKHIKGKTVDSLHKYFADILAKLVFTQPSLLILDDLHVLCERCEGEETPNSMYFNRVSEMLSDLFFTVLKNNLLGILASANSLSGLNKYVYKSRGNHLFKNIFSLGNLNKTDRILLLKHFFGQHSVHCSVDYDELAISTEGFVVQDIKDFYEKALFEAYKETHMEGQEPIIKKEHCYTALKKSCALSLQNVKFHSAGNKTFDDIGGLHDIKRTLIESLLWPVKYSSIFANAPLRLQSGILLYGPPGTGKTLLAGAAAKQCSLRLISIKGPELLSKYIGASEQAVRDIFEKSQRAKPCILFFDEFDSLAPRRGHDNTGVTDRVVNQLLTQLDGVEALTGVCVLAATSRPDLLDPALLRPGRLDKQLLCPMPSQDDRIEILRILSKKMNLAGDVNFVEIARLAEGYSGADLQSVLYTAQISTMKDFVHTMQSEVTTTKISQSMLLEALSKTRPSLGKSERVRYHVIYTKFQGGSVEDFRAGYKVTLA